MNQFIGDSKNLKLFSFKSIIRTERLFERAEHVQQLLRRSFEMLANIQRSSLQEYPGRTPLRLGLNLNTRQTIMHKL